MTVKACDLFSYWADGNTCRHLSADPPKPGEPCSPFHVVASAKGWIPLSLLVFARDAEHAKARVLATMRECSESGATYRAQSRYPSDGQTILDALDAGKLAWDVRSFDVACIAARVNWSGNGGHSF